MKRYLSRQPLALSFLLLLVLLGVGFARHLRAPACAGDAGAPVLLAELVTGFERAYPLWASAAAFLLAVVSGMTLWRLSVKFALYEKRSSLAMPLFAAVVCGAGLSRWLLLEFVCIWLLVTSLRCYLDGFRRRYSFDAVFRGSLALGTLPLLYPPGAVLYLLLPVAMVLMRRGLRETTVAMAGAVLPAAACSYLCWALGHPAGYAVQQTVRAYTLPSGFSPLGLLDGSAAMFFFAVLLFALLLAVGVFAVDFFALRFRQRSTFLYACFMLLVAGAMYAVPSATMLVSGLLAVPCVLILTLFFVRMEGRFAAVVYLVLLLSYLVQQVAALVRG